jgi:hypothetical protein
MEERFDKIEYLIGRTNNTYLKNELKLLKFDIELEIQKAKCNG